jgi:hypothetical protein
MLFQGNKAKLHENKFSDGAAMGLAPNYNCFDPQPASMATGHPLKCLNYPPRNLAWNLGGAGAIL